MSECETCDKKHCDLCGGNEGVSDGIYFCDLCISDKLQECIEHLRLRKFFNKAYENWMLEIQSEIVLGQ